MHAGLRYEQSHCQRRDTTTKFLSELISKIAIDFMSGRVACVGEVAGGGTGWGCKRGGRGACRETARLLNNSTMKLPE